MAPVRRLLPCRWLLALAVVSALSLWLFGGSRPLAVADESKPDKIVTETKPPESIQELKAIQNQVKTVLKKVLPSTVGIRIGMSSGSGIIVSKDGYVLTAGHVSGKPGTDCTVILQDGTKLKAKSLGVNRAIDSGMIKITEEGKEFPFVEMAKSADLKVGQWCVAAGHPGGFRDGRSPVVRVGRVLLNSDTAVYTDCTLVGGDSGGPLFTLEGKVVGIHSRIEGPIHANVHVPMDTYTATWDRLAKSEQFGGPQAGPYIGIQVDREAKICKITDVVAKGPADKAGLKVDDVITKFDGMAIADFKELGDVIRKKKPGDKVNVEVKRGDDTMVVQLVVGQR